MQAIETLPIDQINQDQLDELVRGRAAESKTLEFKQVLVIERDHEKREFSVDIASFANANGGLLLAGIRAENGEAAEVVGFEVSNPDSLVLRVEQILHANIHPRLPWVRARAIRVGEARYVLAVKVMRSFVGAHAVGGDGVYRYFTRGSGGKLPMDIPQVRASYVLAESLRERLRSFRAERTARILAGDGVAELPQARPLLILHLVPLAALGEPTQHDLAPFYHHERPELSPIGMRGSMARRYNVDGVLAAGDEGRDSGCTSYVQLYENGIVEAADATVLIPSDESAGHFQRGVSAPLTHRSLVAALEAYLTIARGIGVEPPVYLMVSMARLSGWKLWFTFTDPAPKVADRDLLAFPEVRLDALDVRPEAVLRPVFDAFWRSFGMSSCRWYAPDGKYTAPIRGF
ncbi:MAG TPA: ATP-binding protein [Planctomycetota bacterium]|nr:ATP-binding protein [Planctomycetota bacterium]